MEAAAQSNAFVSTLRVETASAASPVRSPRPLWQLALPWLLLIPMLYFAANGTFIPHSGSVDTAATGQAGGTDAVHKLSVAFVSILCLTLVAFRFAPVFSLAQRLKLVLAFPLLAIVSFAWSVEPQQSIVSGGILFIFTVFAIYLASRFQFHRQLDFIMLLGGVCLTLSIALALLVPSVGLTPLGWRGMFGHKQLCAATSILFLVTALHWKCLGAYQNMFRAAFILMSLLLIVTSRSRTGWALALVALFLSGALWLLQRVPQKQALLVILAALPIAAAALYALYLLSPTLLTSVGKDSTLSQRTVIWAAAWQAALQRPILGFGFAAFWKGLYGPSQAIVLIAGWGLQQAQNGFLDIWLGIGLVGLALLLLIIAQAFRNAAHCFHSALHPSYVRWCVVVIACTVLYNIGESSMGLVNLNWFLFLLAVIGLSQSASSSKPHFNFPVPNE